MKLVGITNVDFKITDQLLYFYFQIQTGYLIFRLYMCKPKSNLGNVVNKDHSGVRIINYLQRKMDYPGIFPVWGTLDD